MYLAIKDYYDQNVRTLQYLCVDVISNPFSECYEVCKKEMRSESREVETLSLDTSDNFSKMLCGLTFSAEFVKKYVYTPLRKRRGNNNGMRELISETLALHRKMRLCFKRRVLDPGQQDDGYEEERPGVLVLKCLTQMLCLAQERFMDEFVLFDEYASVLTQASNRVRRKQIVAECIAQAIEVTNDLLLSRYQYTYSSPIEELLQRGMYDTMSDSTSYDQHTKGTPLDARLCEQEIVSIEERRAMNDSRIAHEDRVERNASATSTWQGEVRSMHERHHGQTESRFHALTESVQELTRLLRDTHERSHHRSPDSSSVQDSAQSMLIATIDIMRTQSTTQHDDLTNLLSREIGQLVEINRCIHASQRIALESRSTQHLLQMEAGTSSNELAHKHRETLHLKCIEIGAGNYSRLHDKSCDIESDMKRQSDYRHSVRVEAQKRVVDVENRMQEQHQLHEAANGSFIDRMAQQRISSENAQYKLEQKMNEERMQSGIALAEVQSRDNADREAMHKKLEDAERTNAEQMKHHRLEMELKTSDEAESARRTSASETKLVDSERFNVEQGRRYQLDLERRATDEALNMRNAIVRESKVRADAELRIRDERKRGEDRLEDYQRDENRRIQAEITERRGEWNSKYATKPSIDRVASVSIDHTDTAYHGEISFETDPLDGVRTHPNSPSIPVCEVSTPPAHRTPATLSAPSSGGNPSRSHSLPEAKA